MNIWDILVYLALGIVFIMLGFVIGAIMYVSQDDEEMERMRLEGVT